MNLIEKVAELKKQETDDGVDLPLRLDGNGNLWDDQLSLLDTMTPCDSNKFLIALRNAAPKLLAALEMVQVGDAIAFQFLIDHVDRELRGCSPNKRKIR